MCLCHWWSLISQSLVLYHCLLDLKFIHHLILCQRDEKVSEMHVEWYWAPLFLSNVLFISGECKTPSNRPEILEMDMAASWNYFPLPPTNFQIQLINTIANAANTGSYFMKFCTATFRITKKKMLLQVQIDDIILDLY